MNTKVENARKAWAAAEAAEVAAVAAEVAAVAAARCGLRGGGSSRANMEPH